jgi:hypothetical protein
VQDEPDPGYSMAQTPNRGLSVREDAITTTDGVRMDALLSPRQQRASRHIHALQTQGSAPNQLVAEEMTEEEMSSRLTQARLAPVIRSSRARKGEQTVIDIAPTKRLATDDLLLGPRAQPLSMSAPSVEMSPTLVPKAKPRGGGVAAERGGAGVRGARGGAGARGGLVKSAGDRGIVSVVGIAPMARGRGGRGGNAQSTRGSAAAATGGAGAGAGAGGGAVGGGRGGSPATAGGASARALARGGGVAPAAATASPPSTSATLNVPKRAQPGGATSPKPRAPQQQQQQQSGGAGAGGAGTQRGPQQPQQQQQQQQLAPGAVPTLQKAASVAVVGRRRVFEIAPDSVTGPLAEINDATKARRKAGQWSASELAPGAQPAQTASTSTTSGHSNSTLHAPMDDKRRRSATVDSYS